MGCYPDLSNYLLCGSMEPSLPDWASFTLVAALIFVGMSLFSVSVSNGPNQDVSCGLTGWLDLHRHADEWSLTQVRVARLAIQLALAVLATWLLAKTLHGSRKKA
jgi:hypothetical protein